MPTTIALMGAGGKMGCRVTDNLKDSAYEMLYLEVGEAGVARLVAGEAGQEFAGSGTGDRAQVFDDLGAAHADPVVRHGNGTGLLVEGDGAHIGEREAAEPG